MSVKLLCSTRGVSNTNITGFLSDSNSSGGMTKDLTDHSLLLFFPELTGICYLNNRFPGLLFQLMLNYENIINFKDMKQKIFQVDAFTSSVFGGNPAGVCPLNEWLDSEIMQNIAAENNLAETAFFVNKGTFFDLRWFTPEIEIDLCGHATLASGHILFNHMGFQGDEILFQSRSGPLKVIRNGDLFTLDFPASNNLPVKQFEELSEGLNATPLEVVKSRDYLALFKSENDISKVQPDFSKLKELDALGIIITAPGDNSDFVSRFFAPAAGINEDPVTGSAHTMLIPFWAERLRKNKLHAYQISKRGGELWCELVNDRVLISGQAVTYLEGEITI